MAGATNPAMNPIPPSGSPAQPEGQNVGRPRGAGGLQDGIWFCRCNLPAKLYTARKDTPNKGRQFYRCAHNPSRQCQFFKWVEFSAGAGEERTNQPPSTSEDNILPSIEESDMADSATSRASGLGKYNGGSVRGNTAHGSTLTSTPNAPRVPRNTLLLSADPQIPKKRQADAQEPARPAPATLPAIARTRDALAIQSVDHPITETMMKILQSQSITPAVREDARKFINDCGFRMNTNKASLELTREAVRKREEVIRQKDDVIKERDATIEKNNETIKKKDGMIRKREEALAKRDDIIRRLEARITALEGTSRENEANKSQGGAGTDSQCGTSSENGDSQKSDVQHCLQSESREGTAGAGQDGEESEESEGKVKKAKGKCGGRSESWSYHSEFEDEEYSDFDNSDDEDYVD